MNKFLKIKIKQFKIKIYKILFNIIYKYLIINLYIKFLIKDYNNQ